MKKIISLIVFGAAIALLGAGCTPTSAPPAVNSGNSNAVQPPPIQTSAKSDVSISNFSFNPGSTTVNKGTTVVWTNNDSAGHTVTADQGAGPASGLLNPGETYSYTFNEPGTFNYHCSVHPSMKGTVTVNP